MNQVCLVVQLDSISVRPNGSAIGDIWIDANNIQFPARHWNDFVVLLLTWWAEAVGRLLVGDSTREVVRFMEGPHQVEVSLSSLGSLQFTSRSGAGRLEIHPLGEAVPEMFARTLLDQSADVLEICRKNSGWSQDGEDLQEACVTLARAVAGFYRGRQ
jgi:hypothetical protein